MKIIYSKYTFEEVHNTRRNVLKVTICEDGYCEEKSFQLSETEAEDIRENGTFDFSYLDEEWEKIKIKE